MQIVEVSSFGVRSAVITLRRRGSPLRFVLYPMVHMASEGFFREVRRRLKTAGIIVVEGVWRGNSRKGVVLVRALTFSYRVLKFNRRANLVEQDIDYSAYPVPIVHPDLSAAEFADGWKKLSLSNRLLMWVFLPMIVIGRLFGGSRWLWDKAMEETDLPDVETLPDEFDEVLLGERDRRLLEALYRVHEKNQDEDLEVAVVYGAGHVTAIVRGLLERCGYKPRSADWVTVVNL
jgi:hypothetical protein